MAQFPASCWSRSHSARKISCQPFDLITVLGRDEEILLHWFGRWKCLDSLQWSSYTFDLVRRVSSDERRRSLQVHLLNSNKFPKSFAKHWRYLHFENMCKFKCPYSWGSDGGSIAGDSDARLNYVKPNWFKLINARSFCKTFAWLQSAFAQRLRKSLSTMTKMWSLDPVVKTMKTKWSSSRQKCGKLRI